MAKDLNNSQSVADEDLNNADSVNQQGLNSDGSADQQNQDGTLADGTSTDKTVKYEDLKKATDRATAAEEQAAHSQRELELLQANVQGQQQATQKQVTQPGSTFEQAMLNLGVTADDLYGEVIVKVNNEKARLDGIMNQQQQEFSANQQFINSHPDFSQVVGSVNPATGQMVSWSQEASAVLAKKPYLASAFNSAQGAYQAVMDERNLVELEKKAAVNQEHLNRQTVDNQTLPLGGSAAGGGGGSEQNQTQTLNTREQTAQINADIAAGKYD